MAAPYSEEAFLEEADERDDLDEPTDMDGSTFRHAITHNDEFRDWFNSGQPMGDWDH